ncbi:nicotinamide riboside transporter PnuC [Sphingomonas sp.]|uniref:nicotinamide riboside transporter PnuC n=1 Tax=Sphingomonas sp. TaxID=28214 RepID=UPI002ED9D61F
MSPIEVTAAALGLVTVTLVVRRSLWNYPFALAMVLLYGWIFFHEKLYSDALLQIFFFAVNLYGWANWARSKAETGAVRVELLGGRARLGWFALCVVLVIGWGTLMHLYTDAHYPWWDGSIAMLSVVAQYLQSRRYLENWVLWILIDLLAVPLFAHKGLYLTAGLYTIFLALCVWGMSDWAKARRA